MDPTHASPWITRGLYLFALVLVASPMSDLVSTVWPLLPGDLPWRYGFLGLTAGYLLTPILGAVLACAVAYGNEHAGVLKGLGIGMTVCGVLVALAMIVFFTDLLQMRSLRPADAQSGILVAGVLQEFKYGAASLVLVMTGLGAMKTAGRLARVRAGRARSAGIVAAG